MKNKLIILIAINIIFSIATAYIYNKQVLTSKYYNENYSEELDRNQIENLLSFKNRVDNISYFILPVTILLRITLVAFIIFSIQQFFFKENDISYFSFVLVSALSDYVFLSLNVIKTAYLIFSKEVLTPDFVNSFQPFSLINLVDKPISVLIYPLQSLNLFELIYWFLLAYCIKSIMKIEYDKSLKIVLSSYLPALLIWVVFVMFLTVTLNPA